MLLTRTTARKRSSDKRRSGSLLQEDARNPKKGQRARPSADFPTSSAIPAASGQFSPQGGMITQVGETTVLTLDNSALSEFRRCPRRGQHGILDWLQVRRGLGIGPKPAAGAVHQDPPEIAFGIATHKCLDLWWRGGTLDEVETLWEETYGPLATQEDKRRSLSNGHTLLRQYNSVWLPVRHNAELLATEMVFKQYMGKWISSRGNKWKFYYTGRIDKTYRLNNSLEILDHKTTTSSNPNLSRKYQVSRGFLGYLWATHRIWTETPKQITADIWVLSVGNAQPTREVVPWVPERIHEWKSGVQTTFRQIAQWTEDLLHGNQEAFPQYDTGCDAWYRLCPFIPLCENPKNRKRLIQTQFQPKGRNHLEVE